MAKDKQPAGSFQDFWKQISKNRFGLIGFGLSLLQLVFHASWILYAASLASSGQAEKLPAGAWQLWLITGLMIVGALLTMISLFLSLYGVIHGKPRVLAIIGLMLSFFIGTTTTFILLMSAFG